MTHPIPRLAMLAAAALIPLAAGCSRGERTPVSATTSAAGPATTISTGATTPTTSSTPTTDEHVRPIAVGAVVPSYADAERAFHRGRYEEAVGLFAAYSESEPDNAWGHYMLGLSSWKTGDHSRALEAFDAALRLEPSHRKSLLNSARVLLETSRPREALDRVERALAIEPLSGEGLRLAGRARYELGQVIEAIDAYQRALAIDDRDVWSMNNLGYLYIRQGRSVEALAPLARAVEIRGNVPVFQNNFATALERSGHVAAAREAYEAALRADSTYAKASVGLARVNGRVPATEDSTVDVGALSKEFQAEIEQWRERAVAADTTAALDTPVLDSTARDSTATTVTSKVTSTDSVPE